MGGFKVKEHPQTLKSKWRKSDTTIGQSTHDLHNEKKFSISRDFIKSHFFRAEKSNFQELFCGNICDISNFFLFYRILLIKTQTAKPISKKTDHVIPFYGYQKIQLKIRNSDDSSQYDSSITHFSSQFLILNRMIAFVFL